MKREHPYITRRSWELHDRYYKLWTISRRTLLSAMRRMRLIDNDPKHRRER